MSLASQVDALAAEIRDRFNGQTRRKRGYWTATGNSNRIGDGLGHGFGSYVVTGQRRQRNVTTTSFVDRIRRIGFRNRANQSVVSVEVPEEQITTGITISGTPVGGFLKVIRFAISDQALVTNSRMFVGVGAGTISNIDPGTLTNHIGIGHDLNDNNLSMFCGGNILQSPHPLGGSFPVQSGRVYELVLSCPAGSTTITWQVTCLNTGVSATGEFSGNVPSPNTLMSYSRCWRARAPGSPNSVRVEFDLISDFIETIY